MGDESDYHPRLCKIKKWPDFPGYGFNLHAEKGRAGQYIGKVDDDSPAQAAGMKEGDRIVEVEGVNIGNENHSQVVNRIKSAGESVTMLLVDSDTDRYFKEKKVVVSSYMDESDGVLLRMTTPPRSGDDDDQEEELPQPPPPDSEPPEDPPSYSDVQQDEEENRERESSPEREPTPEPPREPTPEPPREPTPEPPREPTPEPEPEPEPVPVVMPTPSHDYHPRLCHVIKWPDFNGYGFNLHGEKDVQGQFIGLVDQDSPAEAAGLRKGDKIIEVNGENIETSNHQEVIMKIKAGGNETKMLVVDSEAEEYYKNNGIPITSSLPEVISKSSERKQASDMSSSFTPRLCHIIKWPDFNGYGFNLHAEKEKGGQYIGKIDDNSPAQSGGLRERDRIIEVNGVNIEDETHRQVITRIKEGGDETKLLVVDQEADSYYKSRGITVSSSMSEVKRLQTTRRSPGNKMAELHDPEHTSKEGLSEAMTGVTNGDSRPTRTEQVTNSSAPAVQANGGGDFLSMNLSAKEMRERLASKKKSDPKHRSNMDFKTKHDLFQKM